MSKKRTNKMKKTLLVVLFVLSFVYADTVPSVKIYIPNFNNQTTGNSNYQLDADGEKIASIITVPKTGSIEGVDFFTGTVTQGGWVKISLQGVDVSGEPDGSILQSSEAYDTVQIGDGDDEVFVSDTFITAYSATVNTRVSIVLETHNFQSGDDMIFQGAYFITVPYIFYSTFYDGSWGTKSANPAMTYALRYSDGYEDIYLNSVDNDYLNVSTATTPDEVGNMWIAQYNCRILGAWTNVYQNNDGFVKLYYPGSEDSSAYDTIYRLGSGAGFSEFYFPNKPVVDKDDTVMVTLRPSTSTSNAYRYMEVNDSTWMAMFDLFGHMKECHRTDAGAWAYISNRLMIMGLIIDRVDDGSGGATIYRRTKYHSIR